MHLCKVFMYIKITLLFKISTLMITLNEFTLGFVSSSEGFGSYSTDSWEYVLEGPIQPCLPLGERVLCRRKVRQE